MSFQKLKSIKPIKGIDSYSKNPILDSLIKQKLQSEMKGIKESFNKIIRKEEERVKDIKNVRTIKKRTLSVQDLDSLNADKIKDSLQYHPIKEKTQKSILQFVTQRQYESPFFQQSHIETVNQARTDPQDILVKIKSADKVTLENHHNHSDQKFYQQLQSKVKEQLPSDLWLPAQAEVQEILNHKIQESQSIQKYRSEILNLQLTNRPSSEGFSPMKSSRLAKTQRSSSVKKNIQITYEPKKYHKSDYQSLEKWLEIAVEFINREADTSSDLTSLHQYLNQIYTIYMCTLKELIRLTYIQSAQKGLILQKIIWSMIRLFSQLIKEQHKTNYNDFKEFNIQQQQQRQLYAERMKKLELRLAETESKLMTTLSEKEKIALTGITYRKVNEQMSAEISALMLTVTELKGQNDYLMTNLIKLIREFQERNLIRIQKGNDHDQYFYLDSKDRIQVVARVPKTNDIQDYFQVEMNKQAKVALEEKKTSNAFELQNTLNLYWNKKMTNLQIEQIVKQYFFCSVQDKEVQVYDGRGAKEYVETAIQCPEEGEETFEQFLKKQLTIQRQTWSVKEEEYQQTQISLKDLYDQLKESIEILSSQNKYYKTSLDHKDNQLAFLNKKLEQLENKNHLYEKKIKILETDIESHIAEHTKLKGKIEEERGRVADEKKKFMFEKENNNLLVGNICELKEKNEELIKRFQDLEDRIQSVAPYLQETLSLPEASELPALINLNKVVEKYLSKYVEKDAKVFLTR